MAYYVSGNARCSAVFFILFHPVFRDMQGQAMGAGDRLTRGILIGGALGALSAVFGYTDNMFMAIGMGAIAGFLAGATHAWLDKKRKK